MNSLFITAVASVKRPVTFYVTFAVLITVVSFYSCLLGCVTTAVWTYKLSHVCTYSTIYPVQGVFEGYFTTPSCRIWPNYYLYYSVVLWE